MACLRMAAFDNGSNERRQAYAEACERWSQKAVDRKFQQLVSSGLLECGVSARTGWLTAEGRQALREAGP